MRSLLLCLAILPALSAAAAAQDGGKLNWKGKGQDPVAQALEEAERDGRPIMFFFTSEGNADCVSLSQGAFSDPAVVQAASKITCIFVECAGGKKNKVLATKLSVKEFPTIYFFDASGNPLGFVSHRDGPALAAAIRDLSDRAVMRPLFPENIPQAMEGARTAKLPCLIYFYDDSPASLTVNRSLNDPELKPIRERFNYAKCEFKKGSEDCAKYDVDRAPTILVLDPTRAKPEEKPLARIASSRTPRELRRDLDDALASFKGGAAAGVPDRPATGSLPIPREKLSDDEVDRRFIQARINLALDYRKQGKKDKAIEVLEDVVQSFPKHVLTLDARTLLDQLKK